MLSDRRHTRAISEYGGLKGVVPRLTAAFVIITLASIGMPGLNGFIGEFLIMLGAFRWDPRFVVVAGLGVILSAVYMLWMVQRVYYGKVTRPENVHMQEVTGREWAGLAPLCVMALLMGIVPTLFTKPMEPAVHRLVERVQSVEPVRVNNEMPNAKFKMQTAAGLQRRGDIDLASSVSPR
jgi:NADH-quinone oxidoreductase subunit M